MAYNLVFTKILQSVEMFIFQSCISLSTLKSHMKCSPYTPTKDFICVVFHSVILLFPTPTFKPASMLPSSLSSPPRANNLSEQPVRRRRTQQSRNRASSSSLTGTWGLKGEGEMAQRFLSSVKSATVGQLGSRTNCQRLVIGGLRHLVLLLKIFVEPKGKDAANESAFPVYSLAQVGSHPLE